MKFKLLARPESGAFERDQHGDLLLDRRIGTRRRSLAPASPYENPP